ncbi:MAG: glycoside hydrolase family 28 protein [Acidobacteriaceae bacterium]
MIRSKLLFSLLLAGLALTAVSVASPANALPSSTICDPHSYGAKVDGVSKDTAAIQAAIDACEQRGGGTVRLSAGTWLSAPIVLKSNITLQLDKGATLLGSSDHQDYPAKTEFRVPGRWSLVSATEATNVSITGEGVIDGAGESWWQEARAVGEHGVMGSDHTRPRLVVFDHCRHVLVEGVTIQNSPMWQLVPYYSDDVTIRNVRVLAPQHSPNTDAIDPFSSSHVVIDHVYADVGDDDVAIKSGKANSEGPDDPSRDITITDCTFLHGHGLSVGSEIAGGAQNIHAERIHFDGTDNGIRIKANRDRGSDVSALTFRDIDMKNVKNAIIISEYYPKILPPDPDPAQPVTRLTPHFHNITLENVTATDIVSAGAIAGLPEAPIRGVIMKNVRIEAQHGLAISNADVSGEKVTVQASDGSSIIKAAGGVVTFQ